MNKFDTFKPCNLYVSIIYLTSNDILRSLDLASNIILQEGIGQYWACVSRDATQMPFEWMSKKKLVNGHYWIPQFGADMSS